MKPLMLILFLISTAYAENTFNLGDGSLYWLGRGHDTFKQKGAGSCLTIDPTKIETISATGKINLDFISDISKVDTYLGVGAKARARVGAVEYSASADYSKETKQNGYSLSYNYIAEFLQKLAIKEADSAPQYSDLLKNGNDGLAWKERCGDEYVYSAEKGARLFLNMKITFISKYQKEKFEATVGAKGPAFSASGHFQKVASDFSSNTRLTISALQIGGDPSKLGRIFCPMGQDTSSCNNSSKQITSCAFGDLNPCMDVLKNFIVYANDPEKNNGNFGSQIENFSNYSTLKVTTQPYYFLGTKFPRITPAANALFERELVTLFELFDEQFQNWVYASEIYQGNAPRKSPEQKNRLEILKVYYENNARAIAATIDGCYEHGLQYCLDSKRLTLSKMDVSENGVRGENYPTRKLIEDNIKPVSIAQFCDLNQENPKIRSTVDYLVKLVAPKEEGVPKIDEYKRGDWCKRLDEDLNSLTSIEINDLETIHMDMIAALINLKELRISNTKEFDFSALSSLSNLETLTLNATNISQLEFIRSLNSLKALSVTNNELLRNSSAIIKVATLNELIFYGNEIDIECPENIKCLTRDYSKDISIYSFQKKTKCYFGINTSAVMVDSNSGEIISTSSSDYLHPTIHLNKLSLDSGNCESIDITKFPTYPIEVPGPGSSNEIQYQIIHANEEFNKYLILFPSGLAVINKNGDLLEFKNISPVCTNAVKKDSLPNGMNIIKLTNGSVLLSGGICYGGYSDTLIKVDFNFTPVLRDNIEKISTFRMKIPRANHTMTEINESQVIVIGGMSNLHSVKEIELVDLRKANNGRSDISQLIGSLNQGRFNHSTTKLNNGLILVAGGFPKADMTDALNSAEIIDGKTFKTKTLKDKLNEARGQHQVIHLSDDRILLVGGAKNYLKNNLTAQFTPGTTEIYKTVINQNTFAKDTVEIFDPSLKKFFFAGKLSMPRTNFSIVKINEYQYGLIGGSGNVAPFKLGTIDQNAPSSKFEIIQLNL